MHMCIYAHPHKRIHISTHIHQNRKGEPLVSHTIMPPAIRLRVHYRELPDRSLSSSHTTSPLPSHTHPRLAAAITPPAHTPNPKSKLTPSASAAKHTTTVFSPAPTRANVRIIQVRDLHPPELLRTCGGRGGAEGATEGKTLEAQMFLNVLDQTRGDDWGVKVAGHMDHAISEQDELELQGCNFAATVDKRYLLRPQCATRRHAVMSGGTVWNDEFNLYSTYPGLSELQEAFKGGNTRVLEQDIVLRGQSVVMFLTVQVFIEDMLLSRVAHATIHLDPGLPDESWHPLFLPSGSALMGAQGREAMVCVAVDYSSRGRTLWSNVDTPLYSSPNVSHTLHDLASVTSPLTAATVARGDSPGQQRASPPPHINPSRSTGRGKVCVRIFEGRNFTMLRQPQIGYKIVCELMLQAHGCEDQVDSFMCMCTNMKMYLYKYI